MGSFGRSGWAAKVVPGRAGAVAFQNCGRVAMKVDIVRANIVDSPKGEWTACDFRRVRRGGRLVADMTLVAEIK
jgi:hypothetical protein